MKKTLLITIDFPPQIGGIANYLANFCENLPPDKIIVLANKPENKNNFDSRQGYKIIREKLFYKYFWPKWLKTYFIAQKIVKQEGIEQVIISHVLPMGYIALLLKLPYICIFHGYDIMLAKKSTWKRLWLKKILKRAKCLIANSNFTKKEIIKEDIGNKKIIIVYPCPHIKPENTNNAETQIIKKELDLFHKKILLSVGRLVARKGFDKVIESLPEILKNMPNLIYLIIGNGPDLQRLKKLAEDLQVRGNIIFIHDLKDSKLPIYYELADIFIMPARIENQTDVEGFGIVYLEANLFKKPVVAGKSGGIEDSVIDGQTGILVDPQDINEISQAVLKLLNNPELMNKLGVQGKKRVLSQFQWPTQIKKIINYLD